MESQLILSEKMVKYLEVLAKAGIHNAAKGFSGMLGQEMTAVDPEVKIVPLLEISSFDGGPEDEVVGIYLRAEGDLATQFMLMIPIQRAMELVDLLMDQPIGTAKELRSLERSALAEVGNLTASFFMNSVAAITGISPTSCEVTDCVFEIFLDSSRVRSSMFMKSMLPPKLS